MSRIGVLLVNLGTPDAPSPAAVKRYLREFLSDPRVVEIPAIVWQPILRGVILNTRPKKSAHAYQQVWTEEGSPLAAITAAQARALQARLASLPRHSREGGDPSPDVASSGMAPSWVPAFAGMTKEDPEIHVSWAMRYGNPAIAPELERLKAAGCDRILFAPLYPQYSGATTATAFDALAKALEAMRWQPAIRTLPPYFDDPTHIAALRDDLSRQLAALPFAPEILLLSFHGMPERTTKLGDPYHDQCRETARLLTEALRPGFPDLRIEISFQSRFGRAKWLEPATDAVLAAEAGKGTRRLAIAAPGFSADCLETREELAIRGREQFLGAGGAEFAALDCLNAGETGMAMLETIVRRELAGWL